MSHAAYSFLTGVLFTLMVQYHICLIVFPEPEVV